MFRIYGIRAADGGGAMRIDCEVGEKKESFTILTSDFRARDISRGEHDDDMYELLCELAAVCRGVRIGRRILSYGANSAGALHGKLIGKGISPDAAERAIAIIFSESGIDESRDALRLCELQLAKNVGARRIITYLQSRGYSNEALEPVREYLCGIDFSEICRREIEKKWGKLPSQGEEKQKCVAYLLRRGFTYSDIRAATKND